MSNGSNKPRIELKSSGAPAADDFMPHGMSTSNPAGPRPEYEEHVMESRIGGYTVELGEGAEMADEHTIEAGGAGLSAMGLLYTIVAPWTLLPPDYRMIGFVATMLTITGSLSMIGGILATRFFNVF